MDKGLPLALAKTSRFYVLERRGKIGAATAAIGTGGLQRRGSPAKNDRSCSADRVEQIPRSFPSTERLYMMDTYLMSAGESCVVCRLRVPEVARCAGSCFPTRDHCSCFILCLSRTVDSVDSVDLKHVILLRYE